MRLDRQDFFRLLRQPPCRWIQLADAREWLAQGACWLDVRTQDEVEAGHWPGAGHLPLDLLALKSRLLDRQRPCLLYCNSGRRSAVAQHWLMEAGFQAWALQDGFDGCAESDRRLFLSEAGDTACMPVASHAEEGAA